MQPPWPCIGIDDMPGNETRKRIPLTVWLLFSNYPVWKSSRTAMARPWIAVNAMGHGDERDGGSPITPPPPPHSRQNPLS